MTVKFSFYSLFLKAFIFSGALFFLTGCATKKFSFSAPSSEFYEAPEFYLEHAKNEKTGLIDYHDYLLAAEAYNQNQALDKAKAILDQIPIESLSSSDRVRYQLILGDLAWKNNQAVQVLQAVHAISDLDHLPVEIKIQANILLAQAYEALGQANDAIRVRLSLFLLIRDLNQVSDNQQAIWKLSQGLSEASLHSLAADSAEGSLQGWAALTLIARQDQVHAERLMEDVRRWKLAYPNHPADNLLIQGLPETELVPPESRRLAVLLPLSGMFKAQAEAVLRGLLYAYYQSPIEARPEVLFYDTASLTVQGAYEQAVSAGADFIVGPLLRSEVETLASKPRSVSILALNYSSAITSGSFYEFGLDYEDELNPIVNRMRSAGVKQVISLAEKNSESDSLLESFSHSLRKTGGSLLVHLPVTPEMDLNESIAKILKASVSSDRQVTRDQNVDAFFIHLDSNLARQVIPILRYYADDIPIYATSKIYDGFSDTRQNYDLNHVIFMDMPWVATSEPKIQIERKSLNEFWPDTYKNYNKLLAVGTDAYALSLELNRLRIFPGSIYEGVSGNLFLGADHRLHRKLNWVKFERGQVFYSGA